MRREGCGCLKDRELDRVIYELGGCSHWLLSGRSRFVERRGGGVSHGLVGARHVMCVFRSARLHVLTGVVPAERTSHSMIRQTAVGRGRTAGRRVIERTGRSAWGSRGAAREILNPGLFGRCRCRCRCAVHFRNGGRSGRSSPRRRRRDGCVALRASGFRVVGCWCVLVRWSSPFGCSSSQSAT